MENIILACRQQESQRVYANGDYKTTLSEPIQIENGDEIVVTKVFIDNRNNNQSIINVEEDIKLDFKYLCYNKSWVQPASPNERDAVIVAGAYNTVANVLHTVCTNTVISVDVGGANDIIYTNEVVLKKISQSDYPDKLKTTTNYETPVSQKRSITFDLDLTQVNNLDIGEKVTLPIRGVLTRLNQLGEVKYTRDTVSSLGSLGLIFERFNFQRQTDQTTPGTQPINVSIPVEFDASITLPKGNYTPTEISETLSKLLGEAPVAVVGSQGSSSSINGPFLFSHNSLAGIIGVSNNEIFYTPSNADGSPYRNPAQSTAFTGTNQISIEYDPEQNKFYFSYLHMPIYSTLGNGAIVVRTTQETGTTNFFEAGSNSGIAFTEVPDFFIDVLGFDRNSTQIFQKGSKSVFATPNSYVFPDIEFKLGDNITENFAGLDNLVVKNATFYMGQIKDGNESTSDVTVQIHATKQQQPSTITIPYIVVDIHSNFKQNYISEENVKRNINGIVGQYYSSGGFTNGTVSDTFSYIHVGEPLYLSSIGVRLLKPDFQLIDNLGSDNSVFIQVVKSKLPQQKKNDRG